jgi:hypothetical protein
MRRITKRIFGLAIGLAVVIPALAIASLAASADDSPKIAVVDGGIGPCTADFTIADVDNKPLYGARIQVHIAYGFMNVKKLDLEVGTNVDGKARFTGLPDKVKHGFYFYATQGDLTGQAFDDPAANCQAQFTITVRKKNP